MSSNTHSEIAMHSRRPPSNLNRIFRSSTRPLESLFRYGMTPSSLTEEKLLQILECSEKELDLLTKNAVNLIEKKCSFYDIFLKILQQGYNIREATLSAIILGEKLGYKKAKIDMEEKIKEKLYRAFKNTQ